MRKSEKDESLKKRDKKKHKKEETREKGLEPPALSFGNSHSTIRTPLPYRLARRLFNRTSQPRQSTVWEYLNFLE